MRYTPDEEGNFSGQTGYGYISIEKFVDAVNALNEGKVTLEELDARGGGGLPNPPQYNRDNRNSERR